ncbi:alpha/beta fold hydrolase [Dyella flagellata]|uniref:Alpha/beta hydrolase n=1 Tax=Dyella flagellata TaxID=1867833 RepID=A0ABQ5XBR8_9GAMM|nr:alpha/beta fold hydrolase [Dyella flagellata]GLQ89060.1 alpha/beta hydrolase [Dyella flagellata]
MRRWSLVLLLALASAPLWAANSAPVTTGSLKIEQHGNHGSSIVLIPGLAGGPWVWQDTVAKLEKDHVVYVLTLAGFDGTQAPVNGGNLFDLADQSLYQWLQKANLRKPILVGHSLGATLALRFASEHPDLISGVVAVDGLPLFPGMDRVSDEQRKMIAANMQKQLSSATPEQFKAQQLAYMQKVGVIDPDLAKRYAPLNARSDIKATAQYAAEDFADDLRPGLKNANVPILEISPYNAPDFSSGPMAMSEQQKVDYYKSLLSNAPNAKVVSISPSRHFVMLDQPLKFQQTLAGFIASVH